MKSIIITGASGLVATELIAFLLQASDEYQIYAITTHPEKLKGRYKNSPHVFCYALDEIEENIKNPIYAVVHCAFARSKDAQDIALSLRYTSELLKVVRRLNASFFINISSQSIYGQITPPLWTEQTTPASNYLYALGKFSTEEMVAVAFEGTNIKYTNIRLSSLCEKARFLNVFAKNALMGEPINLQGGDQICSFIDVRDVASGLATVIHKAPLINSLAPIYNLGSGKTRTIKELAEDTKRLVEDAKGIPVKINVIPADIKLEIGMNTCLFCNTFEWQPKYGYDEMIWSLISLNDTETTGEQIPYSFKILYSEINNKNE